MPRNDDDIIDGDSAEDHSVAPLFPPNAIITYSTEYAQTNSSKVTSSTSNDSTVLYECPIMTTLLELLPTKCHVGQTIYFFEGFIVIRANGIEYRRQNIGNFYCCQSPIRDWDDVRRG